ncbi:MAG: NADH-quinone oxidoreductase subunit [Thermoproteota archaeon]|nr:NADH-quinone oxidoreductase subunit [Thermoproteota archaeon]
MTLNPAAEKYKYYPVVDFGKCVFCYQCVRVCPTQAYVTSNMYNLASFAREKIIKDVLKKDIES